MIVEEGRLFVRGLAEHTPTLDELKDRGRALPKRGIAERYLLRTRGNPANYEIGAWAWVLHRVTGLGLVAYVAVHIALLLTVANKDELKASIAAHSPYYEMTVVLAVGAITYHALNGLRLALGDAGVLPKREQQKAVVWVALGCSAAAMAMTLARALS